VRTAKRICLALIATLILATSIHGFATQRSYESFRGYVLEKRLGENLVKLLSTHLVMRYVSLRLSKHVEGSTTASITMLLQPMLIVMGSGWIYTNVSLTYVYATPSLKNVGRDNETKFVVRRGEPRMESVTIFAEGSEAMVRRSVALQRFAVDTTWRELFDDGRVARVEIHSLFRMLVTNRSVGYSMYVEYSSNEIVKRIELVQSGVRIVVIVDLNNDAISVSIGNERKFLLNDDARKFVEMLKNLPNHIAVKYLNSSVTRIGETTIPLYTFEIVIDVPFKGSNVSMILFKNSTTTFIDIAGIALFSYREHVHLAIMRIRAENRSAEAKVSNYVIETKIRRVELQP